MSKVMVHNTPLVSIIMPCYNAAGFISQSIDSVLAQSYENWELLVVDDMSSDNSAEIVFDYAKNDKRIKLFRLTEKGYAHGARNFATNAASGDFVAFLDSDDIWLPDKLQKQLDFMLEKNLPLTISNYYLMTADGKKFDRPFINPRITTYNSLLMKSSSIHFATVMYSSKLIGKHFFRAIRNVEDYVFVLDLLKVVSEAVCLPEPLTIYRIANPTAVSNSKLKMASQTWKAYREFEELGILKSCCCFACYAVRGFLKYRQYRV